MFHFKVRPDSFLVYCPLLVTFGQPPLLAGAFTCVRVTSFHSSTEVSTSHIRALLCQTRGK